MAWLFWFCEALALCVGAKPNVPNALAKNFLCALGIFLFFSVSGCCLVRYRSVGSGGRPAIATNVLQLGEVADFEALTFNLALMIIRNPNVQFSTKPAILPNCCACCTTQIYKKNLCKNGIFRKFKYARKKEFYAPIICFG